MRRFLTTTALLGILSLSSLPASAGGFRHHHSGVRFHVSIPVPRVVVVLGQPHHSYPYGYGNYGYNNYGYGNYGYGGYGNSYGYGYNSGYGSSYGHRPYGYSSRYSQRYDVGGRYYNNYDRYGSRGGRHHRHSRSCSHR